MADVPYDWHHIHESRLEGYTWPEIAEVYGRHPSNVRKWFKRESAGRSLSYTSQAEARAEQRVAPDEDVAQTGQQESETDSVLLTRDQIERITTLDDLLDFFKVDVEAWMVRDFRVNKWEQHSVAAGITPLYQVRANLVRNVARDAEIARQAFEQALEDMKAHAPIYEPLEDHVSSIGGGNLFVLALMDPHIGMLAWEPETGNNYDLPIAVQDYNRAVDDLLRASTFYDTERIMLVVGNDTLHVDVLQDGKVGTTTAGTPQDFDSRLPKLFTEARRAIVRAADKARDLAPVDIVVVSGNHDEASMYKLGEVLSAWYRLDDRVRVFNEPTLRKYYTYGKNLLGLTHGLEFKRKREPLALIMMEEASRNGLDLRHYTCREWLTGHFHGVAELEHMAPRQNLSETRGIRLRSLPGLTAVDAWHDQAGFWHQRAATGLAYRRSGGLVGLHEFHP